jgi:hypothetical protein
MKRPLFAAASWPRKRKQTLKGNAPAPYAAHQSRAPALTEKQCRPNKIAALPQK